MTVYIPIQASINSDCDGELGDIINKIENEETESEEDETPLKIEEINIFPGIKKVCNTVCIYYIPYVTYLKIVSDSRSN